ncbi:MULTISPECIES: hypothetical protein [unclassified Flavobacterium]|uniref:hypothetical protein n=1 Tax=unclassified Flavobacterium TaxID=196869 RepID=UPI001F146B8D|nr:MULTISPECIES: hypothetical protein [unclassified Flavobacterium]UMY64482.1 hypothetical protein MKO97_08155 [Flavobacterium sp. HJ-32-4]
MAAAAPDGTAGVLPGGGGDRRKPQAADAKTRAGPKGYSGQPDPQGRDAPIKIS